MIVISCPKCRSSFRFDQFSVGKPSVKVRCSVCSHVFVHTFDMRPSIEEEFDTLIRRKEQPESSQHDIQATSADTSQGLEETSDTSPEEKPGYDSESEVQPSSVIREIDSILGKSPDIGPEEHLVSKPEDVRKKPSWFIFWSVIIAAVLLSGLWLFRDTLPFLGTARVEQEQAAIDMEPSFSIPEESVTYEILTSPSEGSVLVIKGVINKLSPRPLQSVMVQARVYDDQNKLIDTRSAFAGIVPHSYEFIRHTSTDIDALLNAQPSSTGIITSSQELPFAIAFYGRPAQEGTSFQVEVKEYQWK